MKILPSLDSLLDRLCVVAGAFLGSQIPTFMQQYAQRLAGHVDELQHLLNQLRQVASYSNKTLEQYIYKFISNSDPDFAYQGEFMQKTLLRWQELYQTLDHLTHASIWMRPYVFLRDFQYEIAQSTAVSFQAGVNLSVEGLCYAAAGGLITWLCYQILSTCINHGYSRAMANFKQSV